MYFDKDQIVFCGDSANDATMFGFFENSVGVANVLDFVDTMEQQPCWITKNRTASGFVELSEVILNARSATSI